MARAAHLGQMGAEAMILLAIGSALLAAQFALLTWAALTTLED
jgi:hypothetical protein